MKVRQIKRSLVRTFYYLTRPDNDIELVDRIRAALVALGSLSEYRMLRSQNYMIYHNQVVRLIRKVRHNSATTT